MHSTRPQQPDSPRPTEPSPPEVGQVGNTAEQTARAAFAALERGERQIAGREIVDPEQACENLNTALEMVRKYFGDDSGLDIDLGDIHFKVMDGNIVGESVSRGVLIDPIMLMHPAVRLAHVIAHELAHQKGEIQNEGLVETFVGLVFKDSGVEDPYEEGVANFEEFARKFAGESGDFEAAVREIYQLYYHGDFDEIWDRYERGLPKNADPDESYAFFSKVFPELDYNGEGLEEFLKLEPKAQTDAGADADAEADAGVQAKAA